MTNVSDENTHERDLSLLERLGMVHLELMDIRRQKNALYAAEKVLEAETKAIYDAMLSKTREGQTILDKE